MTAGSCRRRPTANSPKAPLSMRSLFRNVMRPLWTASRFVEMNCASRSATVSTARSPSRHVDFARPGEFAAVVGPSGCGKSTLMKLVTGLLPPTGGAVSVAGETVTGPLKIVGMAFQNPNLLPWRNTLANTMLPLEIVQPHRSRLRSHRGNMSRWRSNCSPRSGSRVSTEAAMDAVGRHAAAR